MKATELRIGNWVSNGGSIPVAQIRDGEDIDDHIDYDCYFPIPLTEEWLVRFGANKADKTIYGDNVYSIDELYMFDIKNDSLSVNSNVWLDIPVIYVHQLQNLYFALSGEELEIK